MAALLSRAKTNRGQHIDVALSDCQTASLANIASSCLVSGKPDSGRWGTAHPSIVPYKGFTTSNGDLMLGGGNDRLFGVLCDKLGKPEWAKDSRFATNAERVKHRDELEALIDEVTKTKTTQEWLDILEGSGMPYSAINDVQTTLNHDHSKYFALNAFCTFASRSLLCTAKARNMVTEVEHPYCGPVKLVSPPVKFSEAKPSIRAPPPTLGQHTDEVLADMLGMQQEEIKSLRSEGVVA